MFLDLEGLGVAFAVVAPVSEEVGGFGEFDDVLVDDGEEFVVRAWDVDF